MFTIKRITHYIKVLCNFMCRPIHVSSKSFYTYRPDLHEAVTSKLAHQSYVNSTNNFRLYWTLLKNCWEQVKSNFKVITTIVVLTSHPALHILNY